MKVLDSTFLIDLLNGRKETLDILNSNEQLLTTQANMFEVIRGIFLKGQSYDKFLEAKEAFESIRVLPLDDNGIIRAAEISADLIKKGSRISDIDCITAGIALSKCLNTVVTRNSKDFEKIKEIKVETY
ncbi:type II toxin-antitoxin system VapC family toxin [Candidatus Woesearchaeota archaeon]|nr:type II toxin-antitoxin system VapC family toxin [Candidatus Woesearchaeota archaeon]